MRKVIFLLIIILSLPTILWAADPFIGTWKLNAIKSKADHPDSTPKSETLEITSQQKGIKTALNGVSAGGDAYHIESLGKWDGADAPVKGHPAILTFAINKVGTHSVEYIIKKKDGYVESWRNTVSEDGNTLISVEKGKLNGQEYSGSFVYDKKVALDKEDLETDTQAIKNIIMSWTKDVNASDVEKMMSVFADDAIRFRQMDPLLLEKKRFALTINECSMWLLFKKRM